MSLHWSSLLAVLPLLTMGCVTPRSTPEFQALRGKGHSYEWIDDEVQRLMSAAKVPGLALALIENGQVVYQKAYGFSDRDKALPLGTDTIMYGASLTKATFAHLVMQLVDEGKIDLDAPITVQLKKPLPEYTDFADLKNDPRWELFTPRMLLSHSSGLLNWRWINDDQKLDIKYAPGSRFVYSGEGIQILQLIVEERTGTPLADLMQRRVFDRFRMKDTSMAWRSDFEGRASIGYSQDGKAVDHSRRRRARAAGSMDTTLEDYAKFMAGVLRGEGLSPASKHTMLSAQVAIVSPQQFPSHFPGETDVNQTIGLSYGLGWGVYTSPQGPAFFKEGNDNGTNNFALGFLKSGSGLVLLSNSSNADQMFYLAVQAIFGETCLPWFWMGYIPYDRPELRGLKAREHPVPPCNDARRKRP